MNGIREVTERVEIIRKEAEDTSMGSTIMTMMDKLQVRLTALCRWPIDWGGDWAQNPEV